MKMLSEMSLTERLPYTSGTEIIMRIQEFSGRRFRDNTPRIVLEALLQGSLSTSEADEYASPMEVPQQVLKNGLDDFHKRTMAQHSCRGCNFCPTSRAAVCWTMNRGYLNKENS